ncbi:hypothetical protein HanIR_Chr15g0743531 [Helianthus annuus]|nr:hypothetical protein HanIR_Chr15g0743531 [Helianthus annuus]
MALCSSGIDDYPDTYDMSSNLLANEPKISSSNLIPTGFSRSELSGGGFFSELVMVGLDHPALSTVVNVWGRFLSLSYPDNRNFISLAVKKKEESYLLRVQRQKKGHISLPHTFRYGFLFVL